MRFVIISLLLSLLALNAKAELTKNDLQEIEKLLDKHDEQMKQYIDMKIDTVNARIDKVESTLNARVDKVESTLGARIDGLMWFIVLLVAIIVGVIALPQAFQICSLRSPTPSAYGRERKESKQFDTVENQIEKIQHQFDMMMKEFDTLKKEITILKEERTRLIQP
jgi:conjugal transfer/entry exclusion protein